MKKLILLFGAGVFTLASYSQATISNQSFETWENVVVKDSLDFWSTSTKQLQQQGIIDISNSYQITSGYNSATAIHLETILVFNGGMGVNDTMFGFAVNDNADNGNFVGFPYIDTVDLFTCWYKSGIIPGDMGIILVELSNNNITYSSTTYPIVGSQSSWTQLNIPLLGGSSEVPDSVFIGLVSSNPFTPGIATPGSWLEIDELSFDFLAGSVVPSPIPNNSFEDWTIETIEQPSDWFTFDPAMYNTTSQVYVTKSATASHLTSSMQIETTFENIMFNIPSLVSNGYFIIGDDSLIGGSPFNAQPAQVTGEFQYAGVFTDTAWVYAKFWNSTSGILFEGMDTLLDAAVWTPFSIDLTFTEAPDSVLILFYSGDNVGSVLLVDHLQFVGGDVNIDSYNMSQSNMVVYPNPANNQTTLLFQNADVINVIDLNGRLLLQFSNIVGNKIDLQTSEWENGIYIIQLINDGKVETKKLTVQH